MLMHYWCGSYIHICGRLFEPTQPSVWQIEGLNNGTTFTVSHSSNVTLHTTVMEFV